MTEAKYELKNWIKWKETVKLLEETREEIMDTRLSANIDSNELPNSGHSSVFNKLDRIIENKEQYDIAIKKYKFLIDRLENAIASVLNEEQREVCILYASYSNSSERELEALSKGYPRTTFYRILDTAIKALDEVLKVGTNSGLNYQKNKI